MIEEVFLQMISLTVYEYQEDNSSNSYFNILQLIKQLALPNWESIKARLILFLGNCPDINLRRQFNQLLDLQQPLEEPILIENEDE